MKKAFQAFLVVTFLLTFSMSVVHADRGGWADPPGGWTFVEEWHKIPDYEGDPLWNHNNGSDSYSGDANIEFYQSLDPPVLIGPDQPIEAVVYIDTLTGEGETEDGITEVADATVMTLIDLGDPRDLGLSDPSDRKIFFLGALHEPGDITEDPFIQGITFCARYKIFPIVPDPDIGANLADVIDVLDEDGYLRYIPEQSDRAHVGIGYVDPNDGDNQNTLIGTGYYDEGALSILVNDAEDPDGDENIPILSDIDTTAMHSVWVSAQVDPNDPLLINVRAFGDGNLEAVEAVIQRGADVDRPNPEDLQDNDEWNGLAELAFNIGSAGTGAAGAFQYDYLCATMAGAFDPQEAGSADVLSWDLY
jgi:hypothetical protein